MLRVNELCNIFYLLVEEMCMFQDLRITYLQNKRSSNCSSSPDSMIPDPYREEMTGRNFHTFSFGGHLNFEAYVQYREYAGFIKAMNALRGMKLMFKGDDGKAVACNIKVRSCCHR